MNRGNQYARKIYTECGMESPFDLSLEDIVFGRGAIFKEAKITGAEGRILFRGEEAVITVDDSIDYIPKKRFIIAHELGHFEMHKENLKIFNDNDYTLHEWFKKGSQESEANQFAAELLMPGLLFSSKCGSGSFHPKIIKDLSNFFQTSLVAAAIRYADLNCFPVCIYYSIDGVVKWFHPSEGFPYWSIDLTHLKVPTGSVAAEFYNDGTVYNEDDIQEVQAFEWLNDKKIDKSKMIFEFCFTSNKYNSALSIIWES